MKKFLIILMVLAMASVLFVGCTTPPTPAPDPDPDPDPVTVSATPVLTAVATGAAVPVAIIDLTSTAIQYVNKAEAGTLIFVQGTAPAESLVSIYLDDVAITAAVGETSVNGLWSIFIAKSALGDDGVKVMTAKCTEVGLDESLASNAATFTLDTALPSATTLAATATAADDHAVASAITSGTALIASAVVSNAANLVAGTYTISYIAASTAAANMQFAGGTMTTQTLLVNSATTLYVIPGVKLDITVALLDLMAIGSVTTLTVTDTALIVDRARVLFSEEITTASAILPANYTFLDGAVAAVDTPVSYSAKYMYFTFAGVLAQGDILTCTVNGVIDLAGNTQTTANVLTATVGAAHATSLAP